MRKLLVTLIILAIIFSVQLTHAQTPSPICPVLPTDNGNVISSVTLDTTATYTVWSRILAPDTTNNSYYLQIDNQCAIKVGDNSSIPANIWTWVNYQDGNTTTTMNISLAAGDHIIKLIGNEPNVGVDKLVFLRDPNCIPTGLGDNCTALPTATSVPLTPTNTPPPNPTDTPTPTKIPTPTPTVISDKTAPVVNITSPANGSIVNRKSSVTIIANARRYLWYL